VGASLVSARVTAQDKKNTCVFSSPYRHPKCSPRHANFLQMRRAHVRYARCLQASLELGSAGDPVIHCVSHFKRDRTPLPTCWASHYSAPASVAAAAAAAAPLRHAPLSAPPPLPGLPRTPLCAEAAPQAPAPLASAPAPRKRTTRPPPSRPPPPRAPRQTSPCTTPCSLRCLTAPWGTSRARSTWACAARAPWTNCCRAPPTSLWYRPSMQTAGAARSRHTPTPPRRCPIRGRCAWRPTACAPPASPWPGAP
jgi:hypothetical protein